MVELKIASSELMSAAVVQLQQLSKAQLIGYTTALFITYQLLLALYNLYLSPLARQRIPGPKFCAISNLWYLSAFTSGQWPLRMHQLHKAYGPVVRLSPNKVSFISAQSWKDIYGNHSNRKVFLKGGEWYSVDTEKNIVDESDPVKHGRIRKLYSSAFSARSLREQEGVVGGYVDLFIRQLGKYGTGGGRDSERGSDIVEWFNWLTFDIIGDLAFGDPFGSLSEAKDHFWVSSLIQNVELFVYMVAFNTVIPVWFKRLYQSLIPYLPIWEKRIEHQEFCRKKIQKRLDSSKNRKDFLTNFAEEHNAGTIKLSQRELMKHSSVLMYPPPLPSPR
jgi:cytochrome P450